MIRANGNRFSVYTSEEKTVLGVINELAQENIQLTQELDEINKELEGKTDLYGDHKGTWQGLEKPTMSNEGMKAELEKILDKTLPEIQKNFDKFENEKMNKTDLLTMSNMGQDVKEAMTGGSVPVVGINSITSDNIMNGQVTPVKTDFLTYEDIMSQDGIVAGTLNSVGGVNSSNPGNTSDYIPVEEGMRIYIPGNIASMGYYNVNKSSLASTLGRPSSLSNYKGVIPTNKDKVCYIRISWSNVEGNTNYRVPSEINIYKTNRMILKTPFKDGSIDLSAIKGIETISTGGSNIYFKYDEQFKILNIFMKTIADGVYLGYKLRKMTAEYDVNNSSSNYDIWRLRGVGVYQKDGDKFNDILEGGLVHDGSEWECAIKETGMSDFSGGSTHGDEFIDSIVFIVDGKIYTEPKSFADKTCKEFKIIRKSKLYRANTNKETYIADHYVDYTFKNNEIIIDNRVDWKVDTNCGVSYLCMLGAKRLNGTTQITNRGIKQGDGTILDVSTEGHSNNGTTKRCTKAYLWNDGANGGANVLMSVEILDNNYFDKFNFKFDNRAEYNKFYFDQCGQNFNVKNGDIWFNKALYKIDYMGMY